MGSNTFRRTHDLLADIRAELTGRTETESWEIVDDHLNQGRTVHYAVMRHTGPHGVTIFGSVSLIEGGCWIKKMSEDMGPYYYGCPARLLDILDRDAPLDPANKAHAWAIKWRTECRARALESV